MPKRTHDGIYIDQVPSLLRLCFDQFQQTLHPAAREREPQLNLLQQIESQLDFHLQRTAKPNTEGRTDFIRYDMISICLDFSEEEKLAWQTNRLQGTTKFTVTEGGYVSFRMDSYVHPEAWFEYSTFISNLVQWCKTNAKIVIRGRLASGSSTLYMTVYKDRLRIDSDQNPRDQNASVCWAEVPWPPSIHKHFSK